jgi:UDP-N-acetylglucosamine 4,6-dehydratase
VDTPNAWLKDKSILITGGTGTFGRAALTYLSTLPEDEAPRRIIIYSRDEFKQSEMVKSYEYCGYGRDNVRYFIGDVRDKTRLRRAFTGVDYVIHAAALKQVPACEYNPIEAKRTNIDGAENIINAAIDTGVSKVIALSSDKAVAPINLYGATKLVAEKLFTQANAYSNDGSPVFSVVRYGNVAGSRGSVIPLFIDQARSTRRITVTDERMTRFWLTIEEAVAFTLDALRESSGGEIFVPRLPSVHVMSIAVAVKKLYKDSEIVLTGRRGGEKLHEALLTEEESEGAVRTRNSYIIGSRDGYPERLVHGINYTSDKNEEWLDDETLSRFCLEY